IPLINTCDRHTLCEMALSICLCVDINPASSCPEERVGSPSGPLLVFQLRLRWTSQKQGCERTAWSICHRYVCYACPG
ncbi:uncharacterized, partial [Tachysurus ichikawai]